MKYGLDPDAAASARRAASCRSSLRACPLPTFREEPVESNGFPDAIADAVVSSAVLHFARDESQFRAMLRGTWRLVKGAA